ncbi:FAD-dependent oxidoreductase [Vibrio splendidus]|uniref:FAD-dependent oxidoreductase n=1 Tax=Vibrio splendidus TaxID=29497 RepID=UPI0002DCD782|nr:FAD-dependent oxidoreductase [Vibrio splendidus]MDP2591737.1 FAD-dependent oxidoreductase [Vibrio splendidus]OEE53883.1 FAD-dependent oxidoreductase [Vibrio splendidus FF-500]
MTKHYSYWFKQALEQEFGNINAGLDSAKPLPKDVNCDIAIVGGGYTGLWTAILIKQQQPEKHVVVIEKGLCGSGASGANGGCMLTWSTKYPTLKKLYGKEQAKWLVKESEKVIYEIEAFCNEHKIDAHLYRSGTYYTATNEAQKGGMEPVVNELVKQGINSWKKCDNSLADKAGSDRHIEGYYSEAAGSVQPALLARGLRRVALELGVEIHENTEMTSLDYGSPALIQTKGGSVFADKVILALNAWMLDHFKEFKRSIVVVSSDMVVTKPIPEKLKQFGPEKGAAVVDSRIFVHYYRDTQDGRLMLGKGGNKFSFANQVESMFNQTTNYLPILYQSFQKLFPKLEQSEFDYNWSGGSDRSVTGLPFFGNLKGQSNIYYGLGYSGNGVAQTRMGGKILSAMVLDIDNAWTRSGLTKGPLGHFPPEPFRWVGAMMVRDAVRRKENAEDSGNTPLWLDKQLSKLAGAAGKADKVES